MIRGRKVIRLFLFYAKIECFYHKDTKVTKKPCVLHAFVFDAFLNCRKGEDMLKGRTRIFVLIVPVVLFLLAGIFAQTVLYSNKAGKVCASGYNIHSQSGYTSLPKQDEVYLSDKLLKSEIIQKTQRLQMPFIANEGQIDEQVGFYAKTFGGTVFVTKDGEIVYSLPQAPVKKDACRTKGDRLCISD